MTQAMPSPAPPLADLATFPVLDGARIRLRPPRRDDVPVVFALMSDPAVMRYWSHAPLAAESEAAAKVEVWLSGFGARSWLNWIAADPADDSAVGTVALFAFEPRHRLAQVGYSLAPRLWGRGLAAEATSLAIDFAFDTLGLHRLEADIDPGNDASRRLLARLGFVVEGRFRERFWIDGRATDSEVSGLLARDWRARNG